MLAVTQQTERADRDLDPLEALEPAHEEQQAPASVTDHAPSLRPIQWLERPEVDAGRNHVDALGVGAIALDQLLGLVRGRSDQEVRLLRKLTLDANTQLGFRSGAGRERAVLHESERVGDVSPTGREVWPEQASNLAREPVVRVKEVVCDLLAGRELRDLCGERWHLAIQGVLVKPVARGEVDHPRQWG